MNWYKSFILACILAMKGQFFCAQTSVYTWEDFVDEVSDDEYAEEQGWTEHMEELSLLAAHPLDLNTATQEQLQQLPFLNDQQIDDLHTYIFLHRGMRSMSEIMAIPSIDFRTRRFLSLFCRADQAVFERKDSISLRTLLHNAHHEVVTRFDVPLYYRMGYSYPPSQGGYWGNPMYHKIRYQLSSQKHVELGVQAEKDAGEPFRHNRGWDSYGGYVMLRDIKWLRTLVVGDYKMGFGEGLVVGGGFSMGKAYWQNRTGRGIRAKRGMDEVNYFRGMATTFRVGNVDLSVWASRRQLDATLNDNGTVHTILTSGLHRTSSELRKKHNLGSTMTGADVQWKHRGFHVGATGYYQRYNRAISPGDALYRRIFPRGKDFGVMGVNYGYNHLWFSVAGETAYSTERGGIATFHRATWKISPQYSLSGSVRYYGRDYYSFYASAMCENSRVQNETGGMVRLDAMPVDDLTLMLYADVFRNPWPRYGLTHSSLGQEFALQGEYKIHRHNTFSVRYQLKRKERSNHMEEHHRLRLQYTRQQGKWWKLHSMANLHALQHSGKGFTLTQRVRFQKARGMVSALLTYFHTPNYDTRISLYEPVLTEMFRIPSLYGHGMRGVVAGRWVLWQRRFSVELLYGIIRYFDRHSQSTGMQEIRSAWKNDLSVQLRLKI